MSTSTTDWRVAIRRGERQPHLFFWTVEGPDGEVIYADGQHPRECINPHTRVAERQRYHARRWVLCEHG